MHRLMSLVMAPVLAFGLMLASPAQAAEKKIVLQISDGSPQKQTLVLNVANNLAKHYGLNNVKLEIVAFGPGLRLLFKQNANKDRVQSLAASGVRFSACANTVKNMSKILEKKPTLSNDAVMVDAGVARIIELTEQGYTLIRP